jgi:thiazole synthase
LKLARELLDGHALCKLEVLGRQGHALSRRARDAEGGRDALLPTGSQVMVYTSDDPIVARERRISAAWRSCRSRR